MKMGVDFVLTKRFSKGHLVLLTLVSAWLMATVPASATVSGVVISNSVVELGVNPDGQLIVGPIGLTYIPTGGEALAPGCPCEGWGVGDTNSGVSGKADQAQGIVNMTLESFTFTPTSAVSVVVVGPPLLDLASKKRQTFLDEIPGTFLVTHDYHPSISPNLFETTVTIENISDDVVDVRYRRVMDWDIPPTEFSEFVTIGGLPATAVTSSDDNGFSDANPFAAASPIDSATLNVNFVHDGPADHGAFFDFDFGTLAPGGSVQFKIYYGAAGSENEAMAALAQIGAEVYSLGEPGHIPSTGLPNTSANTFIFAFTGVGGTPVIPANTVCIQDDRTNDHILFDLGTGEYTVTRCSGGSPLTGTGRVQQLGCITVLRDVYSGRNLFAISQNGSCGTHGQFRVIDRSSRMLISGFDNDVTDNTCSCGILQFRK